jgi:UDP-glucose 4-epimerase
MRCVVTGGKGFIGSHVVESLLKRGDEVIVIDDESAPENEDFYEFDGANYVTEDICNPITHSLYKGADVVFHLAARSRIQPAMNLPRHTFENNVVGTQSVLEAAVSAGVRRVIYSGSSSYYGIANPVPHNEKMTSDCLNPYSLSKYQGEQLCKLYSRMSGIETIVLRYFNVYGPREPLKGRYAPVVGIFKRQRSENKKLTIVGDGEQKRDFTHVHDVVDANILSAVTVTSKVFDKSIPFEVFNIGTGSNYSVNQVANMISNHQTFIEPRPGEARETLADNTKARERLSWEPTIKLEDVINSY